MVVFFLSEMVIGPLCHGPEHPNSRCHCHHAATTPFVMLSTAHNVLPMLQAPFLLKLQLVLSMAVINKVRLQ